MTGPKRMIERALAPLVGLPLVISRRAVDLQGFQFGSISSFRNRLGREGQRGEYALHVQCAWRIVRGRGIFVGDGDLYIPASTYEGPIDQFEWDQPGANRRDELVGRILQEHAASPLVVERVTGASTGDLVIAFSGGCRLDVFPDISDDDEQWRFFKIGGDDEHFVVTGTGAEYA